MLGIYGFYTTKIIKLFKKYYFFWILTHNLLFLLTFMVLIEPK